MNRILTAFTMVFGPFVFSRGFRWIDNYFNPYERKILTEEEIMCIIDKGG